MNSLIPDFFFEEGEPVNNTTDDIIIPEYEEEVSEHEQWLLKRLGKFSGSESKDLMKSGRSTAKLDWDDINKILDFADGSITYIRRKAHERLTGKIKDEINSRSTNYGKEFEPEAIKAIEEKILLKIKECDFMTWKGVDYAGSTPDGFIKNKYLKGIYINNVLVKGNLGVEIKCPYAGENVIKYREDEINTKHEYFWQMVNEAITLDVSFIIFCIYDSRMKKEEDKLSIEVFEVDEVYKKALKIRAEIANKTIEEYINSDKKTTIKEILQKQIINYKNSE